MGGWAAAPAHARWRLAGVGGSVLLALGGVGVGALPTQDPFAGVPAVGLLRAVPGAAIACVYAGLTVLVVAWLRLGRLLARPDGLADGPSDGPPDRRDLAVTLACWAAPLVVAPPMFSRDVYSYLAQGAMLANGIDPYRFGPSTMGGPLAAQVADVWQDTPAPYGPIFLALARSVTNATGDDIVPGVWGMRLVALGGVALLAQYLPRLAALGGAEPRAALWLGALNPLVLVHLVAGAHNDALMLGLMVAGLVLVLDRLLVPGIVAISLAALVKAPAAVALAFCVPVWAACWPGRWARSRTAAVVFLVAVAATAAATTLAATGYGWIGALDTPAAVHNWMSVTTDLGHLTGLLGRLLDVDIAEPATRAWRIAGMVAALGVGLVALGRTDRWGLAGALGAALSAGVLLGPVVHPWYLLWGLVPLAAARLARRVRWRLALASAAFATVLLPHGTSPTVVGFCWAALGVAVAAAGLALAGRVIVQPVPVAAAGEADRGRR